jgi:hypothetical protein
MSLGRGRRILLGSLFAAGVVALTAALPVLTERLAGDRQTQTPRETAEFTVEGLDRIAQLKTAFNEDVGKVRIYLLISPT